MANNYLDYAGVELLWDAIKTKDAEVSNSKAGFIFYDESAKKIELWASAEDRATYAAASDKTATGVPQPLSTIGAEPFVKDGMLHDVNIVSASEVGKILYTDKNGVTNTYNGSELFIEFTWNTDTNDASGNPKKDYVLLTDIAPVYTGGDGITISNNEISFSEAKSNQIKTDKVIKVGGNAFADMVKGFGITEIKAGTDLTKLFTDLLSVRSWPNTITRSVGNLKITNPGPEIVFYDGASGEGTLSDVEVGTKAYLMIKGKTATATGYVTYSGFDYGWSTLPMTDANFLKTTGTYKVADSDPASVTFNGTADANSKYSITYTVTGGSIGTVTQTLTDNVTASSVAFANRHDFRVPEATIKVEATQTSPSFSATVPALPKYYALSSLEETADETGKVLEATTSQTKTASATTYSNNNSITGHRKLFYGAFDSPELSQLTAANIRAAAKGGKTSGAAAKATYHISAKGTKLYWVAFPKSKGWKVTKALNDDSTIGEYSAEWKSTVVEVGGVDNYSPVEYTVYYYTLATASTTTKAHITIG